MMTSSFRRASAVLLVTASAAAVACSDRRVEDESPGRVSPAADTMGMQDTTGADTTWGADTADVDMNPPGGANPGQSGTSDAGAPGASADASEGGTTVNFEEGVATDASGTETEIGGVTSGDVTVREGAAADEGTTSSEADASADAGASPDGDVDQ